jgi:hypothetical protein
MLNRVPSFPSTPPVCPRNVSFLVFPEAEEFDFAGRIEEALDRHKLVRFHGRRIFGDGMVEVAFTGPREDRHRFLLSVMKLSPDAFIQPFGFHVDFHSPDKDGLLHQMLDIFAADAINIPKLDARREETFLADEANIAFCFGLDTATFMFLQKLELFLVRHGRFRWRAFFDLSAAA